jgi:hypothetical protein
MSTGLFNIFEPGLVRGAAKLNYQPHKRYFYVENPVEGWRVYVRMACFIHEEGHPDPSRFLVVKRKDSSPSSKAWEPAKGQMEGKDLPSRGPLLKGMMDALSREIAEESKIENVLFLQHTGLVYQGREKDYPPNHFFQYHIFRAQVSPRQWMAAAAELDWCRAHPAAHARMSRDKREKDALAWYSPSDTKIMGRWSPRIVIMYLKNVLK